MLVAVSRTESKGCDRKEGRKEGRTVAPSRRNRDRSRLVECSKLNVGYMKTVCDGGKPTENIAIME